MIWFIPINLLQVVVPASEHCFFDNDGVVNFVNDSPNMVCLSVDGVELFTLIDQ